MAPEALKVWQFRLPETLRVAVEVPMRVVRGWPSGTEVAVSVTARAWTKAKESRPLGTQSDRPLEEPLKVPE